ncbi:MAG: hypothetical protein CVT49_14690 [candidate division Zixibacteria bacterium HGW-Zixibacteria-1]|nr:MAG: hypothetical protein CVT49_14690 [candidate division Zixibacteria bacterium HGW-Zixibacteria-1]
MKPSLLFIKILIWTYDPAATVILSSDGSARARIVIADEDTEEINKRPLTIKIKNDFTMMTLRFELYFNMDKLSCFVKKNIWPAIKQK